MAEAHAPENRDASKKAVPAPLDKQTRDRARSIRTLCGAVSARPPWRCYLHGVVQSFTGYQPDAPHFSTSGPEEVATIDSK